MPCASDQSSRDRERRGGPRRSAQRALRPVWVRERAGDDEYLHCAHDLGEGGAFFGQAIGRVVGSVLSLEVELPGEVDPIAVHGRVVRVREGGGPGVAVQFVGMTPHNQWRLRCYVIDATVNELSDRRER